MKKKRDFMNKINQLNGRKIRNVLASSVVLGTLTFTGGGDQKEMAK